MSSRPAWDPVYSTSPGFEACVAYGRIHEGGTSLVALAVSRAAVRAARSCSSSRHVTAASPAAAPAAATLAAAATCPSPAAASIAVGSERTSTW